MQSNGAIFDLMLGIPQGDLLANQPVLPFGVESPALSFEQLLAQMTASGAKSPDHGLPFSFSINSTTANALGLGKGESNSQQAASAPKQHFSLLAEMFAANDEAMPLEQTRFEMPGEADEPIVKHADFKSSVSQSLPGLQNLNNPLQSEELGTNVLTDSHTSEAEVSRLLNILSRPVAISETRGNQLSDGTYEILSVQAKGDQVELTLRGESPQAEPIRLSLSADVARQLLEQSMNQAVNQRAQVQVIPARVAIEQSGQPSSEIATFLQKLNVKELSVRSTEKAQGADSIEANPTADKKVLEFHGQPDGKRVVFDLTVPRRSLTVRTPVKPVTGEPTQDPAAIGNPSPKAQPRVVLPQPQAATKAAEPALWPTKPFTGFEFKNNGSDTKATGEQWLNSLTALRTPNESSTINLSQQLQTARFTLPEDIAQQFKANGRSITIGIEPEQLGPARLHLSLNNHSLTARLTVETSVAKSIVEQSLEQLTQQLDRAGIKVDLISVQVAGGDTNTNMFEQRQQAAFTRSRVSRRMTERIITNEMNDNAKTPVLARPTYVGPGGVNVFA